jgi:uncharacterized repeat protein (TIGR03803 family)
MQSPSAIQRRVITATLALAGFVWAPAFMGASSAQAQTYSVLYSFKGGATDGENPESGLFMDKSGNLYGTTVAGPACTPSPCTPYAGVAFKLTSSGTETLLHRFKGNPDGAGPYAGVTGTAYGTTSAGGTSNMGTVYKLGTAENPVVHSFTGAPGDGAFPYAGLIQDANGNVYGTTSAGGTSNNGVVFELSSSGTETILYNFSGGADGGAPYGGLLRTSKGIIYGTTSAGGDLTGNCFPLGCGVVFQLSGVNKETVLYTFTGTPDGANPYGNLIPDPSGNLYGTTLSGGTGTDACSNGCGTVFELESSGTEKVLYSFAGYPSDGASPYAGLIRDSSGNLYGTTAYGGKAENGVVFKVSSAGVETVLYSFTGKTDGGVPRAPLIMDSAGNLYGTAYSGGVTGEACGNPRGSCGVVFKLAN